VWAVVTYVDIEMPFLRSASVITLGLRVAARLVVVREMVVDRLHSGPVAWLSCDFVEGSRRRQFLSFGERRGN
jgi:hypothetical protein